MRNKHLLLPMLLAIVGLPRLGLASPEVVTVGELSAVQSETALLKAKGERAKALRVIEGEGQQVTTPQAYYSDPVLAGGGTSEGSMPVVKLVYGSSGALRATLLYSNGFEVDAAGGQELPGGYKVVTVSLDSVVLSRSGKRFPLGFSSRTPQAPSAAGNGRTQVQGLPGMGPSPSILSPVLP